MCVSHTIIWNIQLYDMENHSHTSTEFNPSKKATKKKKQRKIPPLDLPMCQPLWWLDAGHHRSTCDHRTTRILGPPNWGYPRPTYSGVREGLGLGKMDMYYFTACLWVGEGPPMYKCYQIDELMIEYYPLIWLFRMFYTDIVWHYLGNSCQCEMKVLKTHAKWASWSTGFSC